MATIGNAPVFPTQSVLPGNLTVTGTSATVNGNEVRTVGTSGAIIQVKQSVEQTRISFGTSLANALTCSITPSSTSNKILVKCELIWGRSQDDYGAFWFYRDDVLISGATATSGTGNMVNAAGQISNRGNNASDVYFQQAGAASFLDSPSTTSSTTYQIKAKCTYGSNIFLNSSSNQNNAGHTIHGISSLTLMEVVA